MRIALFLGYVVAATLALAFAGLGHWSYWLQSVVTFAVILSSTLFLPGYFYRGEPLPRRRRRRR